MDDDKVREMLKEGLLFNAGAGALVCDRNLSASYFHWKIWARARPLFQYMSTDNDGFAVVDHAIGKLLSAIRDVAAEQVRRVGSMLEQDGVRFMLAKWQETRWIVVASHVTARTLHKRSDFRLGLDMNYQASSWSEAQNEAEDRSDMASSLMPGQVEQIIKDNGHALLPPEHAIPETKYDRDSANARRLRDVLDKLHTMERHSVLLIEPVDLIAVEDVDDIEEDIIIHTAVASHPALPARLMLVTEEMEYMICCPDDEDIPF